MSETQTSCNTIDIVSKIVSIVGPILLAVLAIWGERIKSFLFGPKLEIEAYNLQGHLTYLGDKRPIWYYHMKVVNKGKLPANRVRVVCSSIFKKTSEGKFEDQHVIVPFQMVWSPANFHELLPTIKKSAIFDLGSLYKGSEQFELTIYVRYNYLPGFFKKNEWYRIGLEIDADNFHSKKIKWYEIFWDGLWSDEQDQMAKHLVITEVVA